MEVLTVKLQHLQDWFFCSCYWK